MTDEAFQLVNVISFALPAKQFTIETEITEARPLPVVEEMVARLLHLAGDASPAELQTFLGLQDHEFESVNDALTQHRMTTVRPDGRLGLTQLARDAIRSSPQGIPRLVETRLRSMRVAFDIATYHPVADTLAGYAAGLPELAPTSVRKVPAAEIASIALRTHFHLLRSRFSDLRKAELYKVIRAEPIRTLLIPIEVAFRLRTDSVGLQLEREVVPSDAIEAVPVDELEPLISRGLATAAVTHDQGADVRRFADAFNDQALRKFCSDMEFDLDGYVRAFRGNRLQFTDKMTRSFIGPIYLASNRQLAERVLALGNTQRSPFAFWFAPDVKYWANASSVRDFYQKVEGAELFDSEPTQLVTCLRSNGSSDDHRLRSLHSRRLNSVLCYESNSTDPTWEIIVVPKRFAAVLVHLYLDGGPEVSIPLGHMTVEPDRVAAVEDYCKKRAKDWTASIRPLWKESPPSETALACLLDQTS